MTSRNKITSNKPLTVGDLKTLLKYHRRKGDPVMASKLDVLKVQWKLVKNRMFEDPVPSHASFQIVHFERIKKEEEQDLGTVNKEQNKTPQSIHEV